MKVRIKFMNKEIKNKNNILLKASNITKSYTQKKFLKKFVKIVLNDVSLSLEQGKCLGIIGESGSGKSTLGRIITGIEKADSGVVEFEGKNIHQKENKDAKNDISVVFQNYVSSVNPRFSVAQIIAEPLIISSQVNKNKIDKKKIDEEVEKLIKIVGLSEEFLERFPNELSGGQLQRVCIARAIVTKPKFILLDEAVSSLDVSTQVEILDLLQKLKKEYNLSYIFITHDLLTITYICDSVIFFKDGKIEEKINDIRNLKNIKKDLVKNFLKDMNDKDKKNRLEDFFYKENLTNQKLKMTDTDFQLKMKNVQEILLKNDDFSIEKFFANKKMQSKEIFKKIVNFAKSFADDKDIKKLEKYFEKYEKKYNDIDKERLFRTKEKLDYEISHKKNEIDIISKMSTAAERKMYKTQKKVDENNKIIENQEIEIEKNNIEINNQMKKFNEMKDIQKQLPELNEKAKQKAVAELTAQYKRQQNYISIAENKAITELKESKEIKENAEIKAIRQIVSDVENNKQNLIREYKQIAKEEIETEITNKKQELKVLENNINNLRIIEQSNRNSYENYKRNIERVKKENEEIEKQVAEKRNLTIEELAEKSLKNAPISNDEIDDYIEKNQEKFENLLETRQEKIENEIVAEMREDTKQAFSVFQNFMREYAKKIVYKDLIDFREAKRLTVQAFKEVQTTSRNFLSDFIENLKNKVQELIVERQEKQSVKNKIQTR